MKIKMSAVICVNDLTKEYNGTRVVDCVSFSVSKGEIYGLLGRNGAGKTTIMKMLFGISESNGRKYCNLRERYA